MPLVRCFCRLVRQQVVQQILHSKSK